MNEQLVIEGEQVTLTNGKSRGQRISIADFAAGISRQSVQGLASEPIPDNVKWMVRQGDLTVLILEFPPALRMLRWITEDSPERFGPEVVTSNRQLALPYVILKVPFWRGKVLHRVELFYRVQPLRSLEGPGGELYWPNLLNVSPHAHDCTTWFCTQYLEAERTPPGISVGLEAVVHHCFGGQHNYSSEMHEGSSTFSRAIEEGLDERVTNVDRWEAESRRDPMFVLSVAWQTTGLGVGSLIQKELNCSPGRAAPRTAGDLGNLLLRRAQPESPK